MTKSNISNEIKNNKKIYKSRKNNKKNINKQEEAAREYATKAIPVSMVKHSNTYYTPSFTYKVNYLKPFSK